MSVYPLKSMPQEVRKYILKIQGEIKAEKKIRQFSLESTMYHIIREHKKAKENK